MHIYLRVYLSACYYLDLLAGLAGMSLCCAWKEEEPRGGGREKGRLIVCSDCQVVLCNLIPEGVRVESKQYQGCGVGVWRGC